MSTPTNQPRTPAGSPQGGQFASNPGGEEGPDLTGDLRFGPNTVAVQAVIDRTKTLTPDEVDRIGAALAASSRGERDATCDVAWRAARDATRYVEWDAARSATVDAARGAAWFTYWGAPWDPAWNDARDAADRAREDAISGAARHAAAAELTRDLISEDHYNLLMAPWRAGVGTGNE